MLETKTHSWTHLIEVVVSWRKCLRVNAKMLARRCHKLRCDKKRTSAIFIKPQSAVSAHLFRVLVPLVRKLVPSPLFRVRPTVRSRQGVDPLYTSLSCVFCSYTSDQSKVW